MLRDRVCEADGRDPQPSAAVLDSQSAKSAEGGEAIGYDAGKRVRGRKRHLLVDTCGLVLSAVVSSVGAGPGRRPVGADRHLRAVSAARAGVVDGGYVNEIDAGLLGWANAQENLEIVAVPRNTAV